jgi:pilus assembly protein CpaB
MRMWVDGRPSGTVLIALGALLGLTLIIVGGMRLGSRTSVQQSAGALPDQPMSRLVTAAKPIGRGQLIQAADLKSTLVIGPPPPHSIVSPTLAVGRIATVDIQPQQLILTSLVSSDPSAAGLAMLVPVGQRAISIDTTDEIAVGGFLRPGDTVDVQIVLPGDVFAGTEGADRSEAQTLLQNIKVMTVGATLGEPEAKTADAGVKATATERRSLTLAMSPEQLGLFTLARKMGRFYLVLRNPADDAEAPAERAVLAGLRGGEAAPRSVAAQVNFAPRRQAASPRPVELIVGGQRQIIYPGRDNR